MNVKNQRMRRAAVGLCVACELRCTGVFQTCFPQCTSVQCTYCAAHDSQHWYRWPRLCLCTAVVHVAKVKQTLLLLLLPPLFFFSSCKLQTTGAERAQRTAASESTRHAGTTHENSKEILSTHTHALQAFNLAPPRNEMRWSRRNTSNYEGSLPNLQHVRCK